VHAITNGQDNGILESFPDVKTKALREHRHPPRRPVDLIQDDFHNYLLFPCPKIYLCYRDIVAKLWKHALSCSGEKSFKNFPDADPDVDD